MVFLFFSPFGTSNILWLDWRFIILHVVLRKHFLNTFSKFSSIGFRVFRKYLINVSLSLFVASGSWKKLWYGHYYINLKKNLQGIKHNYQYLCSILLNFWSKCFRIQKGIQKWMVLNPLCYSTRIVMSVEQIQIKNQHNTEQFWHCHCMNFAFTINHLTLWSKCFIWMTFSVEQKFSEARSYSITEAHDMLDQIKNNQTNLREGEIEKRNLMQVSVYSRCQRYTSLKG